MIDFTGHILNKIELNDDEQTVSLTIDDNKIFLLKVEGSCCSIGKLIGLSGDWELELPQRIISIDEREEVFQDALYKVYETTLKFQNGKELKIFFDNKSNGYYGSSLETWYGNEELWEFPSGVIKEKCNE